MDCIRANWATANSSSPLLLNGCLVTETSDSQSVHASCLSGSDPACCVISVSTLAYNPKTFRRWISSCLKPNFCFTRLKKKALVVFYCLLFSLLCFLFVLVLFLLFWDKTKLYSTSWPRPCDLSASASLVPRLQACIMMSASSMVFEVWFCFIFSLRSHRGDSLP